MSKNNLIMSLFSGLLILNVACGMGGQAESTPPTDTPPTAKVEENVAQPATESEEGAVQPKVESATLAVSQNEFIAGKAIEVSFTVVGTLAPDAWIGILPSDAPHETEAEADSYDVGYEYISQEQNGVLTLTAPGIPGSYDLRMYDTDQDGQEVASISITVIAPEFVPDENVTLSLNKTTFAPSEEIQIEFTVPDSYGGTAWVGIIPSEVAHGSEAINDQYDQAYQYLEEKRSGTITLNVPYDAGSYDVRLNNGDTDGREVAYITFTVEE